eukprot:Amastigsp_a515415_44.p1 type:complete len:166 gc:universal Amastigsp_a515415_44:515-18(-)
MSEQHFDGVAPSSRPEVKKRSSGKRAAATAAADGDKAAGTGEGALGEEGVGSRVYAGASMRQIMSTIGPGRRAPDDDMVYMQEPNKPPLKAIGMAALMLLVGSILITIGALLITGAIPTFYWRRGYSLIILGVLPFIPGAYYSYMAYGAWRGYAGYDYGLIPEVE